MMVYQKSNIEGTFYVARYGNKKYFFKDDDPISKQEALKQAYKQELAIYRKIFQRTKKRLKELIIINKQMGDHVKLNVWLNFEEYS